MSFQNCSRYDVARSLCLKYAVTILFLNICCSYMSYCWSMLWPCLITTIDVTVSSHSLFLRTKWTPSQVKEIFTHEKIVPLNFIKHYENKDTLGTWHLKFQIASQILYDICRYDQIPVRVRPCHDQIFNCHGNLKKNLQNLQNLINS